MSFTTRFAPSPTGLLHLGHAYSAWRAFDAAREAGGRFILRLEDIDLTRCKAEFEQAIYEDLAWIGLDWERPVRRQSDHFPDYAAMLERLIEAGLAYRCFLTRKEVLAEIERAPHGPANGAGEVYLGPETRMDPGEEDARVAAGESYAWRLSLKACRDFLGDDYDRLSFVETEGERREIRAEPERLGDVVLARKDVGTSYHLAACHDDLLQGISCIVRGEDLFEATHLHVLLRALMVRLDPSLTPVDTVWRHHGLILNPETGKRFAKRDAGVTLRDLREAGETPQSLRALVRLEAG